MTDQEVRELMTDTHNVFWTKWRDKELAVDSEECDLMKKEAGILMDKYQHKADPVILWFFDMLNERSLEKERKRNGE